MQNLAFTNERLRKGRIIVSTTSEMFFGMSGTAAFVDSSFVFVKVHH
jgi:hypothetical protein